MKDIQGEVVTKPRNVTLRTMRVRNRVVVLEHDHDAKSITLNIALLEGEGKDMCIVETTHVWCVEYDSWKEDCKELLAWIVSKLKAVFVELPVRVYERVLEVCGSSKDAAKVDAAMASVSV